LIYFPFCVELLNQISENSFYAFSLTGQTHQPDLHHCYRNPLSHPSPPVSPRGLFFPKSLAPRHRSVLVARSPLRVGRAVTRALPNQPPATCPLAMLPRLPCSTIFGAAPLACARLYSMLSRMLCCTTSMAHAVVLHRTRSVLTRPHPNQLDLQCLPPELPNHWPPHQARLCAIGRVSR
jgi:hypothetical protein